MTTPYLPEAPAVAADPIACPYLGLVDDPATHFVFPTTSHRCYSGSAVQVISVTHQGGLCLTEQHTGCRRYVVPPPIAEPPVPTSSVEASPTRVGGSGARARGSTGRRTPLIPAAALLVAVLILTFVTGWFLDGSSSNGPSGSAGSSPAGLANSPAVSPQSTPSLPPRATPTPRPTASTSPSPTIHVVKFGETLSMIANRYGVTVPAIQAANGITDPNFIVVGQRLIIPVP